MADLLLLGECFPFRNVVHKEPFDNSQGYSLAESIGCTYNELRYCMDVDYLINDYHPSNYRKTVGFELLLANYWQDIEQQYIFKYSHILIVGKRLFQIIHSQSADFFVTYNHHGMHLTCVPNPLARFWWDNEEHQHQVRHFFKQILKAYT